MKIRLSACIALVSFALTFVSVSTSLAQKDPGVRGGPPGGGGPLRGLTTNELALFNEGRLRFIQLESVCDKCNDVKLGSDTGEDPNLATLTNSSGLGARFNGDQCSVLPPAARYRRIRRLPGSQSPGSSGQPAHSRKPDVRPDPAPKGGPE